MIIKKLMKIAKSIIPYSILLTFSKYFTKYLLNFFRKKVDLFVPVENAVLLLEFYQVHGELLPGYIKYFLDLGYNVDVVLRELTKKEKKNDLGLFSCFNQNNKVRIKYMSDLDMNLLLRSSITSCYRHIMINSFSDGTELYYLSFVDIFRLKPICVVHNPNLKSRYFQTDRIISLVRMEHLNRKPTPAVNPHYFGEYKASHKMETSTFAALNTDNPFRRNVSLLFDACGLLYKKGINSFKIKLIGKGIPVPECYRNNIHDFGYLDYNEMFSEIRDSDFFLPLLDQGSFKYANKASGSYQISYGFLKPSLLHKMFSEVSGLNNKNSVLYNDNSGLADAMEKCINMPNDNYISLVNALEASEKELYNTSLDNLRAVLHSAEKE